MARPDDSLMKARHTGRKAKIYPRNDLLVRDTEDRLHREAGYPYRLVYWHVPGDFSKTGEVCKTLGWYRTEQEARNAIERFAID